MLRNVPGKMLAERHRSTRQTRLSRPRRQMNQMAGTDIYPCNLVRNLVQHSEHRIIFPQSPFNCLGGVDSKLLKLPQHEQPEHLIEIGAGQHHSRNGRAPRLAPRSEDGIAFNLRTNIRGSVKQEPTLVICADGSLQLRAGFSREAALTYSPTIRASTISLRKRFAGGGSQQLYLHLVCFRVAR